MCATKTCYKITIFVWKEVYVVGQGDADSSGESDNVKRRDRRGIIDTITNPAYFFANHESKFVLKMKWVINQIRIKSLCQLLFLIVIQFFPTRIELSNNLRMRSKFHFILFYFFTPKEKMKDAISNPCSIFLAICTAFYILWMKLDLLISNLRDSSKLFNSSNYQRTCIY